MEISAGKRTVLVNAVTSRIISYCERIGLTEPIASIALLRSKLSDVDLPDLDAALRDKGSQWERVRVGIKDVPAGVECNACGTRFAAHADWTPCPDCGNPGAYTVRGPYHLKLKEIHVESGAIIKGKKNTLLL